jgi:5-methylcytosine-specific restriction endonuclease McrA
MAKEKIKPTDGYGPHEMKKISSAVRLVWQRCKARQIAVKRCTNEDGYFVCEQCKNKTPKIKIDHIIPVGTLRDGFIERLFCSSTGLQGLCQECHKEKTKTENAARKLK